MLYILLSGFCLLEFEWQSYHNENLYFKSFGKDARCSCIYVQAYVLVNPFSTRVTRPHQNAFWYNNSWLGYLKNSELCTKRERKIFCQKISPHLSQLNVAMAHRNYFRRNNLRILKLATYIQRLKITILGANWQLFRLERIAKCSYFILCTQNIKFYWFVMNIKKLLLPIWWYNRGLLPLGNKYFGVFVLNGLTSCFEWHINYTFYRVWLWAV